MIPIVPERLDWPSAIGSFILNYGVLDWHVLVFLEARLPEEEFSKIKHLHFQGRVARITSLVSFGEYSAEQRLAFDKFFTRLNPIRELRNHIAHGHMLSSWQEDSKTWKVSLALPKDLDASEAPETRQLEFAELVTALGQLTELIEEFTALSGSWRNQQFEINVKRG